MTNEDWLKVQMRGLNQIVVELGAKIHEMVRKQGSQQAMLDELLANEKGAAEFLSGKMLEFTGEHDQTHAKLIASLKTRFEEITKRVDELEKK